LQASAELGIPGVGFLVSFYAIAMIRLWRLARKIDPVAVDIANSCRMVIAALVGFIVAAQFVSLMGLEIPYYVNLVGAGYLKLNSAFSIADLEQPTEEGFQVASD
jgi:hypothetical protein